MDLLFLKVSIQETDVLQECHTVKTEPNHCQWANFVPLAFLQRECLLNAGPEQSRSDLVFVQSRLGNDFIFGMLKCFAFGVDYIDKLDAAR